MTSIREPSTEVPAVSDELEAERHLDPWHAFDRADLPRQLQDVGPVGGGRAGAGGHGGRRENRDEWDIE